MTTITIDRATVEQALEAMLNFPDDISDAMFESITALKAALAQKHDPVAHSGWVLREVLFDNGEPIGHREPQHSPAALEQQAEAGEPVAYIHRQGNHWEVSERHLDEDEKARGWTEEPLYTAPPQRKPLPNHDQHCVNVPGYGLMAVRLVRAVERAHGIGEGA